MVDSFPEQTTTRFRCPSEGATQMRRFEIVLAAGVLFAANVAGGAVMAETPAPLPDHKSVPEKIDPPLGSKPGDPNSTGSTRKLDDGVIEPKTNAPDMRVKPPVPDPGTTPVIPPPGTPGNNPDVHPKT
jgi:hypothetical protein